MTSFLYSQGSNAFRIVDNTPGIRLNSNDPFHDEDSSNESATATATATTNATVKATVNVKDCSIISLKYDVYGNKRNKCSFSNVKENRVNFVTTPTPSRPTGTNNNNNVNHDDAFSVMDLKYDLYDDDSFCFSNNNNNMKVTNVDFIITDTDNISTSTEENSSSNAIRSCLSSIMNIKTTKRDYRISSDCSNSSIMKVTNVDFVAVA